MREAEIRHETGHASADNGDVLPLGRSSVDCAALGILEMIYTIKPGTPDINTSGVVHRDMIQIIVSSGESALDGLSIKVLLVTPTQEKTGDTAPCRDASGRVSVLRNDPDETVDRGILYCGNEMMRVIGSFLRAGPICEVDWSLGRPKEGDVNVGESGG